LAKKKIRRNYYRNSTAQRRAHYWQRIRAAFKLLFSVGAVTAMSLLFIFGYDLLTQSSFFKTEEIKVAGGLRLSPAQVVQQAQIEPGMNIFAINLAKVRKHLLSHAWIADARIRREIPDKVMIQIDEHEPLAILDLGRRFMINAQGTIFKEWHRSDPQHLPVVKGLTLSDINLNGGRRSVPFKAVMQVLKLGRKPQSILPNHMIKRIVVDPDMGLTLYAFDQPKQIKLGYENYDIKYGRLGNVLVYLKRQRHFANYASIDLNHSDRIVVHLDRSTSTGKRHKEV
jgi:cell division protein FtsQ